jgi:hypothetical protein
MEVVKDSNCQLARMGLKKEEINYFIVKMETSL